MSIDQRIREGLLTISSELPEPDTIQALASVTSDARAATRRHRLLATAVAAGAAAAAVIVAVSVTGEDKGSPPPADETPSQTPEIGPPVDPTWGFAYVSDPVAFDDIAANLREHGLGEWVEPLHDRWGDVAGQIRLDFDNGQVTASIPETPASHTNNYIVFRHFLSFEGSDSQFEATATQIEGGGQRLTLTLTKSETAAVDGIPGEVYERALYTTVPFNEIPPPAKAELRPGTYASNPIRFGQIASTLRGDGLGNWIGPLREKWGETDEPAVARLVLDGDTMTVSVSGTSLAFTSPFTTDGSLIRIEDDEAQDEDGWIELYTRPYNTSGIGVVFYPWDTGRTAWEGLPAAVVVEVLFSPEAVYTFVSGDVTPAEE